MAVQTIAEQVYYTIRHGILNQQYRSGEKITLKALQSSLCVSSTPVREALLRLQQDGLIEYQPNVGMRVVEYDAKDVQDIFALMQELDVIALRFACRSPRREEMVRKLEEVQAEALEVIDKEDFQKWEEYSDRFHLVLFAFANNSRLNITAERLQLQFTVFSYVYQQDRENRHAIQAEHDRILRCLQEGDDRAAEEAMRSHSVSSAQKAMDVLNTLR